MHTCPFCGEECDCDWDDCGGLPVPDDCPHLCDELDERTEGEREDGDDFDEEDEVSTPHYYAKTFTPDVPMHIQTVEFQSFHEVEAWFYRKAWQYDVCVVFEDDRVCLSAVDYTRDEYEPLIHLRQTSRMDAFQPYRVALQRVVDGKCTWATDEDTIYKAKEMDNYVIQAMNGGEGGVERTIYVNYCDQVQRDVVYRVAGALTDVYDAARLLRAARVAFWQKETELARVIVEWVESNLSVTAERNL